MKNNTLTTEVVAKCNNLIKEPGILIPVTDIEKMIFTIRGVQVMFDRNLIVWGYHKSYQSAG